MKPPVNDPLYPQQWYLHNAGQTGGTPGIDLDLGNVWTDYTGKGVTVAVFDEGVDFGHPDLGNIDPAISLSTQPSGDGQPFSPVETHGSQVAGIIAGTANNGIGVAGAAFDARLASVYLNLGNSPADGDNKIYLGFEKAVTDYDVCNNSWGSKGFTNFDDVSEKDNAAALADAAIKGRHGLGSVIVFSGGNDRQVGEDANTSNYTNSPYVIGVAAIDYHGKVSSYSTPGDDLLLSGPTNNLVYAWLPNEEELEEPGDPVDTGDTGGDPEPSPEEGNLNQGGGEQASRGLAARDAGPRELTPIASFSDIVTTTNRGQGPNGGDYSLDFGGTSAAGPMVAAVVALMLQANPNLGYRDVQEILADTARNTDKAANWTINAATDWNGGGRHVNRDMGYGLVDAHAAVRLAETWGEQNTAANEVRLAAAQTVAHQIRQDGHPFSTSVAIAGNEFVERAVVTLRIDSETCKDLLITLTSPSGTVSTLLNADADWQFPNTPFSVTSTHFLGENAAGTWTLTVTDNNTLEEPAVGQLISWDLDLLGKDDSTNRDHIYTEEYHYYAAGDSKRTELRDSSPNPVVNASAVRSNSLLDLRPGHTGRIDNTPLTMDANTIVSAAYLGDGNDTVICNDAADTVHGGRGDDYIVAGKGQDSLFGDQGNDYLVAGGGNDILDGGSGTNTVRLAGRFDDCKLCLVGNERVVATPSGIDVVRNCQVLAFDDRVAPTGGLLFVSDPAVTAAYYQAFAPGKTAAGALASSV